ncbi:MAG TPA: class I SAM-dependent methyltransferase [Tepidisphaeraceae bacterium]|nr:class I SAM-dependent methyltransferase [Tepidisphaeraceae bacterium]
MSAFSAKSPSLAFWRNRAAKYGSRAVINVACGDNDLRELTAKHRQIIFPLFTSVIGPQDKIALDFGCGVGRFTAEVARALHGQAIGMDIVQTLLDLAPRSRDVEYRLISEGQIPLADCSIDVVWIFCVLGGIAERKLLGETIFEIDRVLRPGGLVLLIENTSDKPSAVHWIFRSYREYRRLFDFVSLEYLGDYREANERMSIMAGRKTNGSLDG